MKDVKPSTENETMVMKAIQTAIGAYPNGIIGMQTLSDIAVQLNAKCFPATLQIYGHPTIMCQDILPFKSNAGVQNYKNSISGSFSYQKKPCSILVQFGKEVNGSACHSFLNKPETVMFRDNTGIHVKRCLYASELPSTTSWAVGGMGLLDFFNPEAEGFEGQYADVLRRTNHTVLGTKNGMLYLMYFANKTAQEINTELKNKQICTQAILLDGGHVAAINGTEAFAQINTKQVQYYAIQGV